MKETQEQLLERHKRELEEWKRQYKTENLVTLQTSHYGGGAEPYSIQITFPLGLSSQESNMMCEDLHIKMEEWLAAFGYNFAWLSPKVEIDKEQELARLKALKKDLPLTVQAELFDIIDKVITVVPDEWPAATQRGFEKMWQVLRVSRNIQ